MDILINIFYNKIHLFKYFIMGQFIFYWSLYQDGAI